MSKKVLLIADDEEMNRRIIKKFMKDSFEVLEAADGIAAMNLLRTTPVDALLLDIIMPSMDGLEVLKQMQEEQLSDHIGILVATSTKEKTERAALSLGADDVVSKPYDPLVIKKRLENILVVKANTSQKQGQIEPADIENIRESLKKISQYADMIVQNRDNASLIAGIADEIKVESAKLNQQLPVEK